MFSTFALPVRSLLPILSHHYNDDPRVLGGLLAAMAAGGVTASVALARLEHGDLSNRRVLAFAMVGCGASLLLTATLPAVAGAFRTLATVGAFTALISACGTVVDSTELLVSQPQQSLGRHLLRLDGRRAGGGQPSHGLPDALRRSCVDAGRQRCLVAGVGWCQLMRQSALRERVPSRRRAAPFAMRSSDRQPGTSGDTMDRPPSPVLAPLTPQKAPYAASSDLNGVAGTERRWLSTARRRSVRLRLVA